MNNQPKIVCTDCGDLCGSFEETFDYPGTHCTHGNPGTHHTGHYLSDCCHAEIQDYDEWLSSQEIPLAVQ